MALHTVRRGSSAVFIHVPVNEAEVFGLSEMNSFSNGMRFYILKENQYNQSYENSSQLSRLFFL